MPTRGPTNWGKCPACHGKGYNDLTLRQCRVCDGGWLGIVYIEPPASETDAKNSKPE